MSTWGVAFISLGLLIIAYHNFFGIPLIILGIVMMLVARNKKKKADKALQDEEQAHKDVNIKSRK